MERTRWTERTFTFDFPVGWLPNISERLLGTTARASALCRDLDHSLLTRQENGKWSVQEHIGHLLDLEELHEGRIDDFIARKEVLRAADMSNAKTRSANHNDASFSNLLDSFRECRERLVSRLWKLDEDTHLFKALHPRLNVWMRPVDMAYFTAEHDDYHLASIRESILKKN